MYDPALDSEFRKPYTDRREERVRRGVKHLYVHGGFEGSVLRFSLYFPEKERYGGRFFQYLPPAANHEDASQSLKGGDDKILFALTHGAYFVESNMGTLNPFSPEANRDPSLSFRASACAAEYGRKVASEVYGEDIPRPYGYVFGGSGGAYKSIACAENCDVWDGAVPYVNGAPVSVPHNLTVRAHSMRVLRHRLQDVIAALQPGGSGDPYETLSAEEREALDDLFAFGFPKGALAGLNLLKDGALPILIGGMKAGDPGYFTDFWEKPGYAGADGTSDARESRLHHRTRLTGKYLPARGEGRAPDNTTGVDTNWQRYKGMSGALGTPLLEVETMPENDFYVMGCFVNFLTGKAAGRRVYFGEWHGKTLAVQEYFGCDDMMDVLELAAPGDEVLLDNSDYIAASDYHLHALPDEPYAGYARCYNGDGTPKYVQRDHVVNFTGCGRQTGDFRCRMIIEHTLCDESAFPYQADWYRRQVVAVQGEEGAAERFRLQFMDNALHDDRAEPEGVELEYVTNLAAVYQCLLDCADWVEKGIEPPAQTVYAMREGELIVPAKASERKGIQNVCTLTAEGKRTATVPCGVPLEFSVDVEIPDGAGYLTGVEWSFEGEKDFPVKTGTETKVTHTYTKPGNYIAVVRTYNERHGDKETPFTRIRNIDRIAVTVI